MIDDEKIKLKAKELDNKVEQFENSLKPFISSLSSLSGSSVIQFCYRMSTHKYVIINDGKEVFTGSSALEALKKFVNLGGNPYIEDYNY